jgi:two-component system alkaline phosphatase synthesis response regulator PhoP
MSAKKNILLVEDDTTLVFTLSDRLISEGYGVEAVSDGEQGLKAALQGQFDGIVLDVMLPTMNGLDICRELRKNNVFTPILMLTARGQVTDKVIGLKLGADDYLTKPFDTMELLARIEALLRRSEQTSIPPSTELEKSSAVQEFYTFGDYTVDSRRMQLFHHGAVVEVPTREFQLLQYLIAHRGVIVSRNELLHAVWGYDALPAATRTVDTHIAWLRQRIEPNSKVPRYIQTVHGEGYKFVG